MSRTVSSHTSPLPWVSRLKPYVPGKPIEELERELGITGSIKLASNENPLGPSPLAVTAMQCALASLHLYPDGGAYRLRGALAEQLGVTAGEIVLGNGSNEVLSMICRAFLGTDHNAVVSQYAFVAYRVVVGTQGAQLREVPAVSFGHDLSAMAAACDEMTRLLFVANPNNPTGTFSTVDELRKLLRSVPEHVLVVVDEAYFEYVDRPDYCSALALRQERGNLVVTRTFSKAYGIAGIRVGYGVMPPDIAATLNRLREPFNANAAAQEGALAALGDEVFLRRSVDLNRHERARLQAALAVRGLEPVPSEGNFILFRSPVGGAELYDRLLREGVIVRPLQPYGMLEHVRVTVGMAGENDRFLDSLDRVLGEGAR
ncbi:MAG: histidinol-phosphate transaminase [Deltaproteobacteria bacterium]|nr:MAG: histidinol-phosphate transaminase [Deltaproteobacteria bacterium]